MGTIHCYAAYLRSHDDVALNAVSAGFTNEFVEIVLGSTIVIPIATGYLGLDWVKEHISFGVAFQTMPFLFDKWGPFLATIAGVMWFGLLFFSGITSSLAMGTPWLGFMEDEFDWGRKRSAFTFGLITLIIGMPCVLFYHQGVFDEYDYWAGTVSLVVFALVETILFSWIFGIEKGWQEINLGADIRVPHIFKFVIKYITPLMLLFVFLGSLLTPAHNDWGAAFSSLLAGNGWILDNGSLIKEVANTGLKQQISQATDPSIIAGLKEKVTYINGARLLLTALFVSIAVLVYVAYQRRIKKSVKS